VTFPKIHFFRLLKWLAILLVVALLIPPLQVALAIFWNPPFSPMRLERQWENRRAGLEYLPEPMLWVPLSQAPVPLIHFIWASEDQNFFKHRGFDLPQMKKAVEEAKRKGKPPRGSSTITMQCARTVFLWQGRSYVRKALEAYYTLWMELLMSKQRILELYLNNIELGPGIYGIGAAAQHYFHKPASQLTRGQMIALAAILPNPLKWSPVRPDAMVEKKIRRIERLSSQAPFPTEKLKGKK